MQGIAKLIRYYILISTTEAGSGHPTSSLSSVELLTALFGGGFFRFDLDNVENPNNDRFILSKGHSAPLLYSLFAVLEKLNEDDLKKLRKFESPLEGHPTPNFKYSEVATGSLGQGLSIGVGMALNGKYLDKLSYKVWVLLGDSEMSEGSNWEAIQIANYYKLNNLIGIIDVNRLGQRGETMYGWNVFEYEKRIKSFGWKTIIIKDGHNFKEIIRAYKQAINSDAPVMLIAKTIKGRGVSFLENKENWHGKALNKEELNQALIELKEIDKNLKIILPEPKKPHFGSGGIGTMKEAKFSSEIESLNYKKGDLIATRYAYGEALKRIYPKYPDIVALDGEVKNSTFSEIFESAYPERAESDKLLSAPKVLKNNFSTPSAFFEMFIAEQHMVGAALGLSARGKIPFVSTFAAFFTRAFDQIRMSSYSKANIKFIGSHSGVSIGEDGPSQMGLEDIAMFRSIKDSVVLYPADAVSCQKLVEIAAEYKGIVYLRTTRGKTPVIYDNDENFEISGFKILRASENDSIAIISAGITLFEALKASDELKEKSIFTKVVDLYSIKPINVENLKKAVSGVKAIITVEDHYPEGGIGEAVRSALYDINIPIHSLAVSKMPRSGKSEELFEYEEISKNAIIKKCLTT